MLKRAALFACLVLAAAPAPAKVWPRAGGWDIGETEDACGLVQEFEGPGETAVSLILNLDGQVLLGVTNYGWSISKGDKMKDIVFLLDDLVYSDGTSIGHQDGIRRGFITGFPAKFADEFAKAKSLRIVRGEKLVDSLNLEGSGAAVGVARRCLAHVKSLKDAEAMERARWSHIEKDPFANTVDDDGENEGVAAASRANLASLFSQDDYPPTALRANEQGSVGFKVAIGSDGRVTSCDVTSSSGSAALDEQTCRLIVRRARYTPARSATGAAQASTAEGKINWTLPPT